MGRGAAVLAAVNAATETIDAINALYWALPERFRSPGDDQPARIAAVWNHWNEIHPGQAAANLLAEMAQDRVYGMASTMMNQNQYLNRGLGMGPWDSPGEDLRGDPVLRRFNRAIHELGDNPQVRRQLVRDRRAYRRRLRQARRGNVGNRRNSAPLRRFVDRRTGERRHYYVPY